MRTKSTNHPIMQTVEPSRHLKGRKTDAEYGRVEGRKHLSEDAIITKLLPALKANRWGQRDFTLGLLMFRHAMRVGEIVALEWGDINLDTGQMIARRSKGSQSVFQDMQGDEIKALRKLLRDGPTDKRWVFVSERSLPFTRDGVLRMIQRAGIAAGLGDRIHPHTLRHSSLTKAADEGASMTTLKALGGHRSLSSLAGYVAMSGAPLRTLRWKPAR
jgi:integrase